MAKASDFPDFRQDRVGIHHHYSRGHTYDETWEKTTLYCPSCGVQGLWTELGAGDYYHGTGQVCPACGDGFCCLHQDDFILSARGVAVWFDLWPVGQQEGSHAELFKLYEHGRNQEDPAAAIKPSAATLNTAEPNLGLAPPPSKETQ